MTWSAVAAASIGTLLAAAVAALGWLLRRRLSDAPAKERADLYIQLAELSSKLRNGDVSLDDVRALEASMFKPSRVEHTLAVMDDSALGDRLPQSYWSTQQMSARASARLAVLDGQIHELLVEYRGILSPDREPLLLANHGAWLAYRLAESSFVSSQFAGGTFQPLAGTYAAIRIAESYLEKLRADLAAEKDLL